MILDRYHIIQEWSYQGKVERHVVARYDSLNVAWENYWQIRREQLKPRMEAEMYIEDQETGDRYDPSITPEDRHPL